MAWRVLVADDDPEICTLIKTILRSASFEVEVCADAESALVHLQRDKPFDILISDFMLPGISGIELITMVRANLQTARLPILMISGHSNYAMDARAKSAGADHFFEQAVHAHATALDGHGACRQSTVRSRRRKKPKSRPSGCERPAYGGSGDQDRGEPVEQHASARSKSRSAAPLTDAKNSGSENP